VDAELHRQRAAGRFTLSAAEGRHGVSPADLAAAVMEDGQALLWLSRR
jgi:hypothetical protein